jgi:organic hydroperoxide reductase OsmC/OhrA
MSEYTAAVKWSKQDSEPFLDNKYSRAHTWEFDGGAVIPASSAPSVIPVPLSVVENVDPEEGFIASVSSCHMLWFLFLAANKKYVVKNYHDDAVGVLAKNDEGKQAITEITLRPKVTFEGDQPSQEELEAMHHTAHEKCFISNSVKSTVKVEPSLV